jgi:hypothetical protein
MPEPSHQYGLLLGLAVFVHLLIVPDYLIYINTPPPPPPDIATALHSTSYYQFAPTTQQTPFYTWFFGICMALIVLELLALTFWFGIYRVPHYGTLFTERVVGAQQSAWYVAIGTWVLHGITLAASLIFLAASLATTLSQAVLTVLIRLTGIALLVLATVFDLQRQKMEQQAEHAIVSTVSLDVNDGQ